MKWTPFSIWWLAAGYFSAYVFFALGVKLVTPSANDVFSLLPAFVCGVAVTITPVLWHLVNRASAHVADGENPNSPGLIGWRQRARIIATLLARHRWAVLVSGVSTALIVVTTVFALSFRAVSIAVALLMMRGGVLALSPLIDWLTDRSIRPQAWGALGISVAAIAVTALLTSAKGTIPLIIGLNLALYIGAYGVRLTLMAKTAKLRTRGLRATYGVGELVVCVATLFVCVLAVGWLGPIEAAQAIRQGLISFSWGGFALGVTYGWVLTFGTLIYLDHRETSFAVPVNRAASLVSGGVASALLFFLWGGPPVQGVTMATMAIVLLGFGALAYTDQEIASSTSR